MARIELDATDAKTQAHALRERALYLRKLGAWWEEIPEGVEHALVSEKVAGYVGELRRAANDLTQAGARLDVIAEGIDKTIQAYNQQQPEQSAPQA